LEKHIEDREMFLIRSLKAGSQKAFDEIYQMYAKRLYAYSLRFTKSPEDSEEIVQDVFVKLWTDREKIKQEDSLRSLLFIMIKHDVIDAFRTKVNQPVFEDYVDYINQISVNDTHEHVEYKEFIVKLKKAIASLSPTRQAIITLSRIKQLSNREIAEKLSLSEQTVKNQLSIGLKLLKEKLSEWY
jgi:RNA polymerase sigma-70 factor (ECF subfamily)